MNLHAPQDEEASSELRNLAAVPRQIISPANNSSIVGIFQDSLLGAYRLTRKGIEFTPRQAMNLLMCYPGVREDLFGNPEQSLTNFDVLSQILPAMSSYFTNGSYDSAEDMRTSNNVIDIKNGRYLRGQLDKGSLGSGSKGLIHRIFNDYGFRASADFIDHLQGIVTEYMKQSGYSVGIMDLIADDATNRKIADAITTQKQEANNIIQELHVGVFENNTGKTNYEEFETRMNMILNKAREEGGKIGRKSLSKENRFVIMVNAGSKGNNLNIVQMISCLGQQNVDGKRIPYGLEGRTLPHFTKYDDSPEARGFVENSFVQGLSPQELFFHAMGGREGLIDTAVKTSTTGYIQRRLIKGMEDMKVTYDMTVRNNKNKIVQFSYGDDNMDSTKVENQTLPLTHMSIDQIYAHFMIPEGTKEGRELLNKVFVPEVVQQIKQERKTYNETMTDLVEKMIMYRDTILRNVFENRDDKKVHYPVNLQSILRNVENQLELTSRSQSNLSFMEAYQMIHDEYAYLSSLPHTKPTALFETLYYYYLNPKELLVIRRFHRDGLKALLLQIRTTYMRSIVHPGEMVGLIAAQSIGEPTTQLTLNSFTYETPVIVRNQEGICSTVQIGAFVDMLRNYGLDGKTKMEYYPDKDTTYAPTLENELWEIQAPNSDGEITWYRIEAGTRHPVVNEDGTNTMLRVVTHDEQEIVATKAKSFLVMKDGKLVPTRGDELTTDDYVPVSTKQIDHTEVQFFEVSQLLDKKEYIFGSDAYRAMELWNQPQWWKKYHGTEFTVPYSRSDIFRNRMTKNKVDQRILNGFVYPKYSTLGSAGIPERIELNYQFGYLVGAYCAEGCMTSTQISIANNDPEYIRPIQEWCNTYGITTKYYVHKDKNHEGWTSSDLRIYSIVLRDILEKLCGRLSHNKYIDNRLIFSNHEFKHGFLNAYYGGDGTVDTRTKTILSYSTSYAMLNDIHVMLKTMGIMSYIRTHTKQTKNNRGTKPENIHDVWTINVRNASVVALASILEHTPIHHKSQKCRELMQYQPKTPYLKHQEQIPNKVNNTIQMEDRDGRMQDVVFVKVKSIQEIPNTTAYAYDLTVDHVRTFLAENGVCLEDTFHSAGISSKSGVTRGVPRIEEILTLSEKPKNPSMTVFLKEDEQEDQSRVMELMHRLEHTSLRDVTETVSIYFDPDDEATRIQEDSLLLEQYKVFRKMVRDCMEDDEEDTSNRSKWVIRFKIDREELLERNITMDDIYLALQGAFKQDIDCVYSDMNADNLILRVRQVEKLTTKKQKALDQTDEIYKLKNLQDNMLDNVVLRGIRGIGKVTIRKIPGYMVRRKDTYEPTDVWVMDTMGTNLMDMLAHPMIDTRRTLTNDLMEIYRTLGIEAIRQAIYMEFADVLGGYINYHHLSMLCDRMTMNHKPTAISRHGTNNDDIGPLAKASFEETPKMFLEAAQHAELDTMSGVSANVMCGQEAEFGTSIFDLVVDMERIAAQEGKELEKQERLEDMFGIEDPNDPCSIDAIKIEHHASLIGAKDLGTVDDTYDAGF